MRGRRAANPATATAARRVQRSGLRVLLIAGTPNRIAWLQAYLAHHLPDEHITTAITRPAALHALSQGSLDLVFHDETAPLQANSTVRRLRRAKSDAAVIAITGRPVDGDAAGLVRAGISDVVPGDDPDRLRTAIARARYDIKVRRKRERAEGENRRLAALLRDIQSPIVVLSSAGKVQYANPEADEVRQRLDLPDVLDILPEDNEALLQEALAEPGLLLESEVDLGVCSLRWRYVASTQDGNVNLYAEDITDARKAHNAAQHSKVMRQQTEEKLEDALLYASESIALYDREGRLTLYNGAFVEMMRQCGCPVELGIPFQAIARVIALSIVPERLDDDIEVCVDADLCVEARMTRFWGNVGPVEYPLPNGSWWRINERRTRNGGVVQVASDITRWKQAQTALRASEQRAQDFAAASADWFWEMDAGLRFTYVSENHEEASGFQSSAVVGKRRADFIEGVDPASRERHFRTLRERQPFRDFVYRRKHGSGEEVWINASGLPVFGEDGSFLGYRGVARNVTEKLRAETALRESEQRLRDLLDGSIQGILIHRDLRPLFVNRAWAEIHGYTVREVMAMETVTDLFHTDDFARMNDYRLARLRGEEAPDRYEYRGVRKDGSFCWIELQASVIAWDGAPAVLAAAVDITNRKAAEEQLRRSEQKYRSMLNSTSEGYWLIDAAGKTVEVNAALCRMLEYDAEDFVGKSPLDFSQGENHAAFAAQMARIPREGQRTYEVVLNKRSGEEVIAYFNATTLFDEDGKAVGSFALIRDETARRRSENQLRQAQKMEAIGQLSGGIAHDFNNLLVPILGLSKISARLLPDDSPAKSNMDKIGQAADRARKLVDQILAFSRKDKAERAALSLGRLVSEALTLLRSSLPTTIRIEHDVLEGDDTVLADETQLFQVLLNLGSNARHAMGIEGGVLSIRLAGEHLATPLHVQTATLEPGPYLHLTISDTGCGMPPERVARVFDPFYTTKEVGEGTGLGLSVVHGIVESHGGGIDVESAVGQGTALHIYLPRAAEEALVSDDPTSECVADASRHLQPANPPSMVNPATHT